MTGDGNPAVSRFDVLAAQLLPVRDTPHPSRPSHERRAVVITSAGGCRLWPPSREALVSVSGSRSLVAPRPARPADLPAVLTLVRQHRVEAHAEGVLSGQTPGAVAAAGFRRLLADPAHRVVLAVLPGPNAPDGGGDGGELAVGPAVLGVDPLLVVLGVPQVTVDNLLVHPHHPRFGARAALL